MMNMFSQIDTNTTVWLTLDGQEYELSQFNINFGQNIDQKGEPQNQVRGGQMTLSLTQALPANIYDWAMKSTSKEGSIVFKIESGSAPLKIEFTNAFCVSFNRNVNAMGGGLNTTMTISPEEISINGFSFDNHWVE
ncbi:type VI secretion system tube protein TssD [Saccharicrinis fermentans]|nr:type VI secretion system tube protein TssD [Saccharicrinis fermentans]